MKKKKLTDKERIQRLERLISSIVPQLPQTEYDPNNLCWDKDFVEMEQQITEDKESAENE